MADEIIVADNEKIRLALVKPEAMESLLLEVQSKIKDFTGDVTTNAGRKEIASMAYKVARTKTTIDDFGKDLVGAAKAEIKKIDDARKLARETLDGWKADVRKPLTDWEEEQARGAAIIERIIASAEGRIDNPEYGEKLIADIESIDINSVPEEMRESLVAVKAGCIEKLKAGVADAVQREADARELERLRKQEAKRLADEAKAAANVIAARKAQVEAEEAAYAKVAAAEKALADAETRMALLEAETKVQQTAPVPAGPAIASALKTQFGAAVAAPAPAPKTRAVLMNEAFQDILNIGQDRAVAIALVKAIAANEIRNVQLVG